MLHKEKIFVTDTADSEVLRPVLIFQIIFFLQKILNENLLNLS